MSVQISPIESDEDLRLWSPELRKLERGPRYPLGNDFFHIDHGEDYFAFFRRLGEPHTVIAHEGERVVGAMTAVRTKQPDGWYLCDLKIHSESRGHSLARRLLFSFRHHLEECNRFYGISMNPAQGHNRIFALTKRWGKEFSLAFATLNFYSLDADAMDRVLPEFERSLGPCRFVRLQGIKEIVLESTGAPLDLWHMQHGSFREERLHQPTPVAGAFHMFCFPEGTEKRLPVLQEIPKSASATIIHQGLDGADWSAIHSSDV